jgi:Glycosyl hydrolases family 18
LRRQLELSGPLDDVSQVTGAKTGARRIAIGLAVALASAALALPAAAAASRFAPYVDMTLNSDSLAKMKSQSGVGLFTFGFIVSGQPCQASWGGYYGLDDPTMNQRIAKLKQAGGTGIVSFGGAAGQELADTCTTVASLQAQYQAVINRYGIRNLDFDIEGADQANTASLTRRFKAIARLQAAGRAAGKPVQVSLTVPVMPTGLTYDGLQVVHSAIDNGVHVGVVNIMAMDYYDSSLNYNGRMGDYAIQAARATHTQLAGLYPSRSDAAVWRMVGVTPMLGVNDDPKEVFTTQNAMQLTAFAKRKHLGRLAMWSANRDHPCTGAPQPRNNCSGLGAADWAFSKIFRTFAG